VDTRMVVVRGVMITLVTLYFTRLYKQGQINKLEIDSKCFLLQVHEGTIWAQFIRLFWGSGRGSSPRLGLGKIEA